MWRAAVPANERVRPVAELGRGGLRFPQTGAARRAVLRVVEEEANDVHIFSGRETIRIPRRPSYGVGPVLPIKHANAAIDFRCWVFEAFDRQPADWRVLYDSDGVSPWTIQSGTIQSGGWGAHTLFPVEPSFPSSRFRIRLTNGNEHQCMHIRGFELFGAILPPWRIEV